MRDRTADPDALPPYLAPADDGVFLNVRVIPRARRTVLAGTRDGALLVRVAAPPVEGAANDELTACLARCLDVPARLVQLIAGERGRHKRLRVASLTASEVARRLAPHLPGSGAC